MSKNGAAPIAARSASNKNSVAYGRKLMAEHPDDLVRAITMRRVPDAALTPERWPALQERLCVQTRIGATTLMHTFMQHGTDGAVKQIVNNLSCLADKTIMQRAMRVTCDERRWTALHAFASRMPFNDDVTRFVMKRVSRGAMLETESDGGNTAAHCFALVGNIVGVRCCIALEPLLTSFANKSKMTPSDMGLRKQDYQAAQEKQHVVALEAENKRLRMNADTNEKGESVIREIQLIADARVRRLQDDIKTLTNNAETARKRIVQLETMYRGKETLAADALKNRRAAENEAAEARDQLARLQEASARSATVQGAQELNLVARETDLLERAGLLQQAQQELEALRAETAAERASALAEAEKKLSEARALAAAEDEDAKQAVQRARDMLQTAENEHAETIAELEEAVSDANRRGTQGDSARVALELEKEAGDERVAELERALERANGADEERDNVRDEQAQAIADADERVRALIEERDSHAIRIEEREQRVDELEHAVRSKRHELEDARTTLAEQSIELGQLETQLCTVRQRATELEARVADATDGEAALREQLHTAQRRLEAEQRAQSESAAVVQERLNALQSEHAATLTELEDMRDGVGEQSAAVVEQLEETSRQMAAQGRELATYKERAQQWHEHAQALTAQHRDECDALKRANSARMMTNERAMRAAVAEAVATRAKLEIKSNGGHMPLRRAVTSTATSLAETVSEQQRLASPRSHESSTVVAPLMVRRNAHMFANIVNLIVAGDTDTVAVLLSGKVGLDANTPVDVAIDPSQQPQCYLQMLLTNVVADERTRAQNPDTFASTDKAVRLERAPAMLYLLLSHGATWAGLDSFIDEERHGIPASVTGVLSKRDQLSPFFLALLNSDYKQMKTHLHAFTTPNHVPQQFPGGTPGRLEKHGYTYVHIALELWSDKVDDIVELLMRDDIRLDVTDARGRTAMHMALRHFKTPDTVRCVNIVQLLLEYGATPSLVCSDADTIAYWSTRASKVAKAAEAGGGMLGVAIEATEAAGAPPKRSLSTAATLAHSLSAAARKSVSRKTKLKGMVIGEQRRAKQEAKQRVALARAATHYTSCVAIARLTGNARLIDLTTEQRYWRVTTDRIAKQIRDRALMYYALVQTHRSGELAAQPYLARIFSAVQHVLHYYNPYMPRHRDTVRSNAAVAQPIADKHEQRIVAVLLARHKDEPGTLIEEAADATSSSSSDEATSELHDPAPPPIAHEAHVDELGVVPALALPPPLKVASISPRRPDECKQLQRSRTVQTLRAGQAVGPTVLGDYCVYLKRVQSDHLKGSDMYRLTNTLLASVQVLTKRDLDVSERIYASAVSRFPAAMRAALARLATDEGSPIALSYVLGRDDGLFGDVASIDTIIDDERKLTAIQVAVAKGYVDKLEWLMRRDARILRQRAADGTSIDGLAVRYQQPLCLVAIDYFAECKRRAELAAAAAEENTGTDTTARRMLGDEAPAVAAADSSTSDSRKGVDDTAMTATNCKAANRHHYGMRTRVKADEQGATVLHLCVLNKRDDLLAFCLTEVMSHRATKYNGRTPLELAEDLLANPTHCASEAARQSMNRCCSLLRGDFTVPPVDMDALRQHTLGDGQSSARRRRDAAITPRDDDDDNDKDNQINDVAHAIAAADTPRRRRRRHKHVHESGNETPRDGGTPRRHRRHSSREDMSGEMSTSHRHRRHRHRETTE